jgi:hypothetical protein
LKFETGNLVQDAGSRFKIQDTRFRDWGILEN